MRDAKCVPEYYIRVLNIRIAVGDPFRESLARLAGRLRYVATGGMQLVVGIGRYVHSVTRESGTFPDERSFSREQFGHLPTHEFVGDGLVRVGVEDVGVCHFPRARGDAVVVGYGFADGFVLCFLCEKGVSVRVFGGADGAGAGHGVGLVDGVVGAVDVGVDA